jgi:TPR repeat protein
MIDNNINLISMRYGFILILFIAYSNTARSDQFEMGMASLKAGDFAEAYCLWRPLAMQGHIEAAFHLGWLYANGNGLRVNIPKAVYWWTRAANKGHPDAMFALALAYSQGEGIEKDDEQAMHWYLKAARSGHEDAREILKSKIRTQSKEVLPYLSALLKEKWSGDEVEVSVARANLRAGPGIDQPLAGRALQGERFIAIQEKGKWYQVIKADDLSYAWIAEWLTDQAH